MSREHFVLEYDSGDVTKVIGWIIRRIGSNVAATAASVTYKAALQHLQELLASPLTEYQGSGWPWVKAALVCSVMSPWLFTRLA